jgi:surface polysaccharide O-acyltransferase-like enzyme
MSSPKQRHEGIDLLKVVCCFSVILLHALVYRVERYDGSTEWMLANILSAATREAVPVFFMVSGAFMLRSDIDSLGRYFVKAATRYAVPLLGGLVAYKLLALSQGDASPLLSGVLYNVRASIGFHLWFMWTFLGLALVVPLLRPMVAKPRDRALFLGLWMLYCVAEPWMGMAGLNLPVDNMLFVRNTGYFVAGYALFAWTRQIPAGLLAAGIVASVAATAALTAVWSAAAGSLALIFYEGPSPFLALYSACAFKWASQRKRAPWPDVVRRLSGATFTVYIYHVLALSLLSRGLGPTTLFMRVCVHTPLAFAACVGLHFLGRRVPVLRHFFKG